MAGEEPSFVGIDLGGTEIKACVMAAGGHVLWRSEALTGASDSREGVLQRIVDLAAEGERAVAPAAVAAAGFAIPGVLDIISGRVELLTNFTPEWTGFALRDALEERTGLPAALINDVRAATVAEQKWGAGRALRNFICIAIGTGIGGGLVLNGELYMGSRGAAGELGHQTMLSDGPLCNCGNRGCLEALASGYAISRQAQMAIEWGDVELARLTGTAAPTPRDVAAAALSGSAGARAILATAGEWIGRALANAVCMLNPEAVIVGGGVASAGDLLLEPMRAEIERRTVVFSPERGGIQVLASPLGNAAGSLGAATWAAQQNINGGLE